MPEQSRWAKPLRTLLRSFLARSPIRPPANKLQARPLKPRSVRRIPPQGGTTASMWARPQLNLSRVRQTKAPLPRTSSSWCAKTLPAPFPGSSMATTPERTLEPLPAQTPMPSPLQTPPSQKTCFRTPAASTKTPKSSAFRTTPTLCARARRKMPSAWRPTFRKRTALPTCSLTIYMRCPKTWPKGTTSQVRSARASLARPTRRAPPRPRAQLR